MKTYELRKRRRKLENNDRHGGTGNITWDRFYKTSKISESKMVWSC